MNAYNFSRVVLGLLAFAQLSRVARFRSNFFGLFKTMRKPKERKETHITLSSLRRECLHRKLRVCCACWENPMQTFLVLFCGWSCVEALTLQTEANPIRKVGWARISNLSIWEFEKDLRRGFKFSNFRQPVGITSKPCEPRSRLY